MLGLGLKYIPRYPVKPSTLYPEYADALFQYVRNIKWRVFYGDSSFDDQPLHPPTKPLDPKSLPESNADVQRALDVYLTGCEERLQTTLAAQPHIKLNYLDQLILDTLESLSKRKDIVFKPADKNLGTTVMFTEQYNKLCTDILSDSTTYVVCSDYDAKHLYASLRELLLKHGQLYASETGPMRMQYSRLTKSLIQLARDPALRVPAFYCLPKMHKQGAVKGRPIVSSINSVTYHASVYLHNYLVQFRPYIPNICTNSTDVVLDMETLSTEDPNLVVVCADVASLYPSIPIDYGLQAVRNFLLGFHSNSKRHGQPSPGDVSLKQIDFIIDLLEWVLRNNYMQFMGVIYHQLTGTAMGTPVAVMFADIVLAYLERPAVSRCKPLYYSRYLDDLFIILHKDFKDEIVARFNAQCSSIQLDAVTHGSAGIYLDLKISISAGERHPTTCIYQKDMNRFNYIVPSSSHGPAVGRNLVITELKRYRVRCSADVDFDTVSRLFYDRLVARGYTREYLDVLFRQPPDRPSLLEDLRVKKQRRKEEQDARLLQTEPITGGKSSVLVYVPCIYNRALRIPWQEVLRLPSEVTENVDMCTVYDQDGMRIIVGAKNPKNAAYYLSRLRNLLPTSTNTTTPNPVLAATSSQVRNTASVVASHPNSKPNGRVTAPPSSALRQTTLSSFFARR